MVVVPPRAVPLGQGSGVDQDTLNKEDGSPMRKAPVVKFATPDTAGLLAGLSFDATVAMADVADDGLREGERRAAAGPLCERW